MFAAKQFTLRRLAAAAVAAAALAAPGQALANGCPNENANPNVVGPTKAKTAAPATCARWRSTTSSAWPPTATPAAWPAATTSPTATS
jgi:hypothetical protein